MSACTICGAQVPPEARICAACRADVAPRVDVGQTMEWASGLEGVQTHELVDELLKRGWVPRERIRNGRKRVVLLAPQDNDPQATRRSG